MASATSPAYTSASRRKAGMTVTGRPMRRANTRVKFGSKAPKIAHGRTVVSWRPCRSASRQAKARGEPVPLGQIRAAELDTPSRQRRDPRRVADDAHDPRVAREKRID